MSGFEVESCTWYAICWTVVILRWISRWMARGSIKNMQLDDFLMALAMVFESGEIVSLNIVAIADNNQSDGSDPSAELSQDMIDSMIWGSKWTVMSEQMQLSTTWLVKMCILLMYYRITLGFTHKWFIHAVGIYTGVSFLIMQILFFGVWCRPFDGYWAVPQPDVQCSNYTNHLITNAVVNISTDLMIFAIPLPMLVYSTLPMKKKFILSGVFALGVVTIMMSILNKYNSFTYPDSIQWIYWYCRESATAIIVANIPFTWGLLRRLFHLGSFEGGTRANTTAPKSSRIAQTLEQPKTYTHSTERDIESGTSAAEEPVQEPPQEERKQSAVASGVELRPIEKYKTRQPTLTGASHLYPSVAESLAEQREFQDNTRPPTERSVDAVTVRGAV